MRPGAEDVGAHRRLPGRLRGGRLCIPGARELGREVLSLVRTEQGAVRGLLGTECPNTACFLQAADCDAWYQPITQTACTKLWESRCCPTRADSATPPRGAGPGWHPAATARCWGSSSVRQCGKTRRPTRCESTATPRPPLSSTSLFHLRGIWGFHPGTFAPLNFPLPQTQECP